MKKIIFSFFALSFIALCFSMNLHAQSSEQDLDQRELTKQFIGTWTTVLGEDTLQIWEVIPSGKGYEQNNYWQAKGDTYNTVKGLGGFTRNYRFLVFSHLYSNGVIIGDMAEFVSDTKLKIERYSPDHKHVTSSIEINRISPDKFKATFKSRGMKETWDDAVISEYTYTRIKK